MPMFVHILFFDPSLCFLPSILVSLSGFVWFKLFLWLVGAEFNEMGRCSSGVVPVSNCSRFKEDDIRCLYKFIFNIF